MKFGTFAIIFIAVVITLVILDAPTESEMKKIKRLETEEQKARNAMNWEFAKIALICIVAIPIAMLMAYLEQKAETEQSETQTAAYTEIAQSETEDTGIKPAKENQEDKAGSQ